MMRICPTCRKEFQDDYRFCAECGARLEEKPEKPQGDADVVISRGSIVDGGVHINKTENGSSIVAQCNQIVRMMDGMVVPVPGLPIRFTATVAPGGRAIQGVVVNALGESASVQMQI